MKVVINGVEYIPQLAVNSNAIPPLRKLFAQARAHSGLSVREAAERAGLSYRAVFDAECDGGMHLETAVRLAELYGIDFRSVFECVANEIRRERKFHG